MKKNLFVISLFCGIELLFLAASANTMASTDGLVLPDHKEFRIERGLSREAQQCIDCHSELQPGIVVDWSASRHAHANITCLDCHAANAADIDLSKEHLQYAETKISAIVSPKDCSRCHPYEAAQYAKSKHANTLEIVWSIDPWMKQGMNNAIERSTGCYHCHGSVVNIIDGVPDSKTWPNVGVGRINPDGSRGSCSSCHTRHKFSLAEARRPESCGQCHLGPDHPQLEIYNESKHGAIYNTEGEHWNWTAAPGTWTPGVDYRTPTCSVCHMSGVRQVPTTHDVTERLAWETQAPLTVRPQQFKPMPAKTDWKDEREKMKKICQACHSAQWTNAHFERFDAAVTNYNEVYYKPMKKLIDRLYDEKLLNKEKNLDEKLEIDFYELWHHEGRRARFGAAMMAPDYAWWHGFYELKKRCMAIEEQAELLLKNEKAAKVFDIKGTSSDTKMPDINK
ncbi:MAG: multiheme c-type cytochrome [Planctomycetota bacterium]